MSDRAQEDADKNNFDKNDTKLKVSYNKLKINRKKEPSVQLCTYLN